MSKYINASMLEAWCDAGIQAMEEVLGNKPMVNLWDVLKRFYHSISKEIVFLI